MRQLFDTPAGFQQQDALLGRNAYGAGLKAYNILANGIQTQRNGCGRDDKLAKNIKSEVTVENPGQASAAVEEDDKDIKNQGSSLDKMLSILDIFTPERPICSTNDIIQFLGTSRSTGYRYIKSLHSVGLLGAVGNGYYVLGPRIIELDLQIRGYDPLLQACKGVLEELVETTGQSALLCTLYSNSVLCIRELRAPFSPEHLFSRGQKRSLFKGAMSKIILAHLPAHRYRSIYHRNSQVIAESNLGTTWKEFRDRLAQMRKEGIAVSHGEFLPGIVGVSAPIFNSENLILGSVGIACEESDLNDVGVKKATVVVKRAGREITRRIAATYQGIDLPPRAIG